MKNFELYETLSNINKILNDKDFEKIYDRLLYGVSCTTSPQKYIIGLEIISDSHQKYIKKISEIISELFKNKYNELNL